MIKSNLIKFFIIAITCSHIFAGSFGKSHSAELLSRGRSVPIAMFDDTLVAAKTFSSLTSRILDVYSYDVAANQLIKESEMTSPNPTPGDDFGFSIALSSNYMVVGAPGYKNGHGIAFLYKKNNGKWELYNTFDNPVPSNVTGTPHKFGYNVTLTDKYVSISSPFYNDGLVYVYNLDSIDNSKSSTKPFHTIDVRKLGDVEGCYAIGPNKFGFGISASFNDNKLLIGSLKEFVYMIEYKDGIPFGIDIPSPISIKSEDTKIKFGESVYVGKKNLYISALEDDGGKGRVFVYPYLQSAKMDEDQNPWINPYKIQPVLLEENSHFGYKIVEHENKVSISTFNEGKIFNYIINDSDRLELVDDIEGSSDEYFGRNIVLSDNLLITGAYYADKLYAFDLSTSNKSIVSTFSTGIGSTSIKNKIECTNGFAGSYPCKDMDLMSFTYKTEIGGSNSTSLNDIWGWTDPQTGKEYALVGMSNGTSFVDISNPENPVYIGRLPTQTNNSTWRDLKVYQNHVFIVSEASGHGMQVFDLTELRNFNGNPITFSNIAYYSGFGNAHNIFINEDTGFAYAVGTGTCGPGGLHIIDISNPSSPTKSACVSDPNTGRSNTGYSHDVQCVVYDGPDSAYVGKEICFGSNETRVWISDVSTKSDDNSGAKTIGLGSYDNYYTHQGWLTEDHRYFIVNDELDESNNAYNNTRTLIWNVEDLNNPVVHKTYFGPTPAIDHNNYIIGNNVYMSHYTAGLRVMDISDISNPTESAYFDVYPSSNNTSFDGTWSNFPYYGSGNIVVTGIDEGLFVVSPSGSGPAPAPEVTYTIPSDGNVTLNWQDLICISSCTVNIYRSLEPGFTPDSSNLLTSISYPTFEFTDSNLDENIFYYYRLSVISNGQESLFTDEIRVKPVFVPNQAPTIDVPDDVQFFEDSRYDVVLTGISYGNDINPQNITIDATSDNNDLFSGVSIDYDPAANPILLSLIPNQDKYGTSLITLIVKDDGGTVGGGVDSTMVSFNADVLPVNDAPASFNTVGEYFISDGEYITGLDFRTVYITPENVNDSLRFVWNATTDIDGDDVSYRMIGYQGLEFLTMDENESITDNYKTWALKDLAAQTDTVTVLEGFWNVIASDGLLLRSASMLNGQMRIDGRQLIPDVLAIRQSYPNPFTDFTTIEYDVPSAQDVVIKIFNIKGQTIKTLVNENKSAGYYTEVWDGTNDDGDEVSSGVYFCQMYTPKNPNGGRFVKAKKMVKIR
ncbi:MAG: choice-of-anchor B family protein [Candidatus Marinimicrobia bacterium]|nr:choice-of-anchor B family protein [Candidatus Neomarinimicrobiota bacterium]